MSYKNQSSFFPENAIAIMDAEKVENWLHSKKDNPEFTVKAQEALIKLGDADYMIGIKKEFGGGRFDNFLTIKTFKRCIDEQIFRRIECDICTHYINKDHIYYTGVMGEND